MSLAASSEHLARIAQVRAEVSGVASRKVLTRLDRVIASGAEGGAAAGLVTVSTIRCEPPEALKVIHSEARFTRLQKNVGIAGKLHQAETAERGFQVLFVTLTYRPGVEWDPAHMTSYIDKVRNHYRWATKLKLRYVWVAELQERGAVHYHVIFWVKRSYLMPKADKRGFWPHGMTKTEAARKSGGSVVYLMSYIKKHQSKEGLPNGCRVYGVGGVDPDGRSLRRWINYPRFVQARASASCRWDRAVGGGWTSPNGCHWPSEWGVSAIGKGYTRIIRLRSYPATPIDPSGPFSWINRTTGSAAAGWFSSTSAAQGNLK